MPTELLPTATDAEAVAFELERFERADDGRLEVSGHWLGVRGRRFVRPTLMVVTESSRARLLADLEHKPWSPTGGELWRAAFPWEPDGDKVVEVELAVTPDIAIPLPRPGQGRTAESPISAPRRKPSTSTRRRTENRQLRDQLDSATGALQAALVARNEAVAAAAHERKRLAAERQRVDAEGARLVGERDLAVAERDRLAGERDRLAGERDAAVAELDRLVGERDRLKAELARVAADLDACVAALEEARNSREKLPTPEKFPTVEKLPTSGISHRALPARAPLKYQPAIIHARLQRAFATAMLLAALVALAVILRIL